MTLNELQQNVLTISSVVLFVVAAEPPLSLSEPLCVLGG